MKGSSVYWFCPEINDLQRARAAILDEVGYRVIFFENLELLTRELCSKQAQVLIVSDNWQGPEILDTIRHLANLPEINGARLLLTNSGDRSDLIQTALHEGFRDILPDCLSDAEWLQRFEFSTSGVASILELRQAPEVSREHLTLRIPARLVWVNDQQLWLETRSGHQPGEKMVLQGALASALGISELELTVQQRQQTHLSYRFSEALIADWYHGAIDKSEPQQIVDMLDHLDQLDIGPRPRIFLALQSPALRTTVSKYLDRRKYEVHLALQQNSLLYEPKYFSPDLVFIEDRLMNGENRRGFHELLRFLPDHTSVVSIGGKEDSSLIKNLSAGRQLRFLKNIPNNLSEMIERDYLANLSTRKSSPFDLRKVHTIPNEHALSSASLRIDAELCRADDFQLEFTSKHSIGNYSLLEASSPLLQQKTQGPTFLKVVDRTESTKNGRSVFYFKAHVCNVPKKGSMKRYGVGG